MFRKPEEAEDYSFEQIVSTCEDLMLGHSRPSDVPRALRSRILEAHPQIFTEEMLELDIPEQGDVYISKRIRDAMSTLLRRR